MSSARNARTDADSRILEALDRAGPADAKTVAARTGLGYSTVTARLRRLAAAGKVVRDSDPGERGPARWRTARPATAGRPVPRTSGEPARPAEAGGRTNGAVTASGRPRRRKRQLREELLVWLRAHPDTAFKVSELSKALGGASPGAVANAAHKLVHTGEARQTAAAPATFQAN